MPRTISAAQPPPPSASHSVSDRMADAFVVELSPTALPLSLIFAEATLTPNSTHRMAYDRARHIEHLVRWPTQLPPSSATASTDNMQWPERLEPKAAGRLLGYLLVEAYNQDCADAIAREINSCGREEPQDHVDYALADLARFYSMTLMKPFLKNAGKTPYASSHSSRPLFNLCREEFEDTMEQSNLDYGAVRKQVFVRDNHRCLLSGWIDRRYYSGLNPSQKAELRGGTVTTLQCAHIIPHKLNSGLDSRGKSRYASTIWTILERWGRINIDELNGEQLSALNNMFVMASSLHDAFDNLDLWFTPQENNTYRVEAVDGVFLSTVVTNPVTFTSSNLEDHPLPAKEFFELHRVCARVFHLSGVAEYVQAITEYEEEIKMGAGSRGTLMDIDFGSFYDSLTALAVRPQPHCL